MKIFFGTDGWRGIIGDEINPKSVEVVAQAFSDYLLNLYTEPKVAVGFDGRKYSKDFADIFASVLSGNKIKVFLSNKVIPTPALSFAVKNNLLSAGVMITASHNPPNYNGIKFKAEYGGPFLTEETLKVEKLLFKNVVKKNNSLINRVDLLTEYTEHLSSLIDFESIGISKINVLIDSMGGAGQNIIENILAKNGIHSSTIFATPDSNFYGRNAEPISRNLQPLSQTIKNSDYSIGLATDGDADRIGVVLDDGNFLSAQETILLIADFLINTKKLPGNIVKTSSVTNKLFKLIDEGRKIFDVQVGFKYICEKMISEDILFGCEESGGFGYKNHIPERDGILSALILCELLAKSRFTKLTELIEEKRKQFGYIFYDRIDMEYNKPNRLEILPKLFFNPPKYLAGLPVNSVQEFLSSRGIINGLKFNLQDFSRWLLIRASETEPLIRIYAEGNSDEEVKAILFSGEKLITEIE